MHLYAYVGNNPTNANDPDGKIINSLVGGGIGAVFDYGAQRFEQRNSGEDFKWNRTRTGIAFIAGFATSGMSVLAGSAATGYVAKTAVNAGVGLVGNVGQTIATNMFANATPKKTTVEDIGNAALYGAVFGAIGGAVGDAVAFAPLIRPMANYSSASTGARNFVSNMAELNNAALFSPSPKMLATGSAVGNIASGPSSFLGPVFPSNSISNGLKSVYQCFR